MSDNPYAAPQSDPATKPVASQSNLESPYGGFREVSSLRTILLALFGCAILLSILQVFILSSLNATNTQIDDDWSYETEVDQWVDYSDQVSSLESIVYYITVVMWCIWKNKSCKNAWLFQSASLASRMTRVMPTHQNVTPGWAVGWYFVPILNLWKPYQAMTFIRDQVSGETRIGSLVGFWWLSWLVTSFASNYYYRDQGDDDYSTEEAIAYNEGLINDSIIAIIAASLAATLIHKLTVAQNKMASRNGISAD